MFLPSHAAVNVGKVLFPLFALALELPETYFDDKVGLILGDYSFFSRRLIKRLQTQNSAATMKALRYPSQDGHPEIDDVIPGVGAHTECLIFFASFLLFLMSFVVSRSDYQRSDGLL